MPWLQGKHIVILQDSATPHTGKGNSEISSGAGKTEGWSIRLVTQQFKSPDLNIMGLFFFRSLKCRVMGERFGFVEEIVKVIKKQYEEYDETTLDRAWQLLLVVYNQVLRYKGGIDFSVEHTGVRKRQLSGELENMDPKYLGRGGGLHQGVHSGNIRKSAFTLSIGHMQPNYPRIAT
ncbi:unnamed protein product [Choristocarpus tenellus]